MTRFKTHSMNNAKWVRVLNALSGSNLVLLCLVKLVWDDDIRELQIDGMVANHDFWPEAIEGGVSGIPRGWYAYKEFEMLEFPARVCADRMPHHRNAGQSSRAQDLTAIRAVFHQLGVFDLEQSSECLRMFAYR